MSEKKELNKEQLHKIAGGVACVKYICNECSNEIPEDAETILDAEQTYLDNPNSVNAKFLKKCPHCNKFVEYHAVLK